jgi:hypothetical protein
MGLSDFAGMGGWGKDGMGMPCPTPASERKGSCFFLRLASALLAHRLAVEFNAVRIVNDAIQNTVGYRDITHYRVTPLSRTGWCLTLPSPILTILSPDSVFRSFLCVLRKVRISWSSLCRTVGGEPCRVPLPILLLLRPFPRLGF